MTANIATAIASADLSGASRHLAVMGQSDAVLWRIPTNAGELRSIELYGTVKMSLNGVPVDPWQRDDQGRTLVSLIEEGDRRFNAGEIKCRLDMDKDEGEAFLRAGLPARLQTTETLIAVRFLDSNVTRHVPAILAGDKEAIAEFGADRLEPAPMDGYTFEVGHLGWMAVPKNWPKV